MPSRSWWNDPAQGMNYEAPRHHLFEQLGLSAATPAGDYPVGQGRLIFDTSSPAALSHDAQGGNHIRELAGRAAALAHVTYREANHFTLRRGPFVVAAGLDESAPEAVTTLQGRFVDLFDADLPVLAEVALKPGSRRLLLDLDRVQREEPKVVAAACKVFDPTSANGRFRFLAEGPARTEAVVRVATPNEPMSVTAEVKPGESTPTAPISQWDGASKTVLIRFPNAPDGRRVTIELVK